jgi:hypothetical protein
MIYSISGSDDHPLGRLQAVRDEECREAMYSGDIHVGDFDANAMNRDDFHFTDVIDSFCVPVFNARFKQACEALAPGAVEFHQVRLVWGKEDLLEWVGGQIEGFYVVRPRIVDIIDENLTPMRFWPKLKTFKLEDYVITALPPQALGLFVDHKRPHQFMVTEPMRELLQASGIRARYWPLPVHISQ